MIGQIAQGSPRRPVRTQGRHLSPRLEGRHFLDSSAEMSARRLNPWRANRGAVSRRIKLGMEEGIFVKIEFTKPLRN